MRVTLDDIANDNVSAPIVILAGDFNKLQNIDVLSLGLINIVNQPTHHGHNLDRIYTSEPLHYICKVVKSTVPTVHKAIVAVANTDFITDLTKKSHTTSFRKRTPCRNAALMRSLSAIDWSAVIDPCLDAQSAFNHFYDILLCLLHEHYPLSTVTITSRDPPYVTPVLKIMLRSKINYFGRGVWNRLTS